MTSLQTNPVLLSLAARVTRERITAIETAAHREAWILEESRKQEARIVDALRKRRERRWNKILGRRADGHVIRPIPPAGRSRYGAPILTGEARTALLHAIQADMRLHYSAVVALPVGH